MQEYPYRLSVEDMKKITKECKIYFMLDEVVLIDPSQGSEFKPLYFEADKYVSGAASRPFAPSDVVDAFIALHHQTITGKGV